MRRPSRYYIYTYIPALADDHIIGNGTQDKGDAQPVLTNAEYLVYTAWSLFGQFECELSQVGKREIRLFGTK